MGDLKMSPSERARTREMVRSEAEFLHAVATPLTVALMNAKKILEKGGDQEALGRLEKVLSSLSRIEELLKNRRSSVQALKLELDISNG